jgi:hypothetical protein
MLYTIQDFMPEENDRLPIYSFNFFFFFFLHVHIRGREVFELVTSALWGMILSQLSYPLKTIQLDFSKKELDFRTAKLGHHLGLRF